ncbi:MAG: hypothetical protein IKD15_01950 [Clostridia bacterium]|nr:hypothetical protein [Clostridia bacterium]
MKFWLVLEISRLRHRDEMLLAFRTEKDKAREENPWLMSLGFRNKQVKAP